MSKDNAPGNKSSRGNNESNKIFLCRFTQSISKPTFERMMIGWHTNDMQFMFVFYSKDIFESIFLFSISDENVRSRILKFQLQNGKQGRLRGASWACKSAWYCACCWAKFTWNWACFFSRSIRSRSSLSCRAFIFFSCWIWKLCKALKSVNAQPWSNFHLTYVWRSCKESLLKTYLALSSSFFVFSCRLVNLLFNMI